MSGPILVNEIINANHPDSVTGTKVGNKVAMDVNLVSAAGGDDVNIVSVGGEAIELGQALEAASLPVVLTAVQITTLTPPAAITNYALETGGNLATAVASLSVLDDWDETDRAKVNIIAGQAGITAGAGSVATNTPRVTLASDDPAVASLSVLDDWDESDRAKVNPIVGQAGVAANAGNVSALTQRVVDAGSGTASVTSVADTASSVQLLAANTSRLKYSVFNNSTEILYLKSGTTASLTDFTVALPPLSQFGYYEEDTYTGRVDGIWANNAAGAALITEYT